MTRSKYIDAQTFEDFKTNQTTLIEILNHNMTKLGTDFTELRTDVTWLKAGGKWALGILGSIFLALLGTLIAIAIK